MMLPAVADYEGWATVTHWADGDTLDIAGFRVFYDVDVRRRLRPLGYDAPERGDPGYREAKEHALKVCSLGTRIYVRMFGFDQWKRVLATVVLPDGKNLADELAKFTPPFVPASAALQLRQFRNRGDGPNLRS